MSLFVMLMQLVVLAYALLAGVFLAFSDFIMRSLAHTSGHGGVEAMQSINREVFRWVFMVLFIGMAPVSLALAGYGAFYLDGSAGQFFVLAGLVYLLGSFAVTVFCNVPMNERLAQMDPTAEETRAYWTQIYLRRWTGWNTLRASACALSAILVQSGLLRMAQAQLLS
jgi:uncharacterized membrane protein